MHHGVKIKDSAIIAAVTMSHRYITDRFLPDKAIDLIDEAASAMRITIDSKPVFLDEIDRKIIQLKIAILGLRKEQDQASQQKLHNIEEELQELEKKSLDLTALWQAEKSKLNRINQLKNNIEEAKFNLEKSQREGNFTKAGELTYSIIPTLQKELSDLEKAKEDNNIQDVGIDQIAEIVAKITGIAVDKLMSGEQQKLLKIEDLLQKRVVGQERAVSAIANSLRRARAGLQDEKRPIGSFLFLGPTGVGKTEIAKALAEFIFDDEKAMLRIDMTEYMEKHSIARLIGAPPGYVGFEQGGILTEAVRIRPYQVILFDEVEKAHKDIFNILLQIFDDGRLTDSKGMVVNFTNTIIILTSNIAAGSIVNEEKQYFANDENILLNNQIMQELNIYFRPEFINRLDEIIIFNKLSSEDLAKIVEIQFLYLAKRLASNDFNISIDEKAKNYLAIKGYDKIYGARPLKRLIQREIENILAIKILSGEILPNSDITISCNDNSLSVKANSRK
jgi:ATP-dependent Clp protease ATP-binding subunit ClpB